MIERIGGMYPPGRSKSTGYKDLVWTVATASDEDLDLTGQTSQTLDSIEANLVELGSDKTRIVSAQVYISNIDDKPVMDKVWNEWIGSNPEDWPQRACLGVDLGGHWLIEVTVTAVR
jgi:enamine deaminase RidA (YjgF/YER057c/UK114 family)